VNAMKSLIQKNKCGLTIKCEFTSTPSGIRLSHSTTIETITLQTLPDATKFKIGIVIQDSQSGTPKFVGGKRCVCDVVEPENGIGRIEEWLDRDGVLGCREAIPGADRILVSVNCRREWKRSG
jgi:hypothetical protein